MDENQLFQERMRAARLAVLKEKLYWNYAECCEALGIGKTKMRELEQAGHGAPFWFAGGTRHIQPSDAMRWFESLGPLGREQ